MRSTTTGASCSRLNGLQTRADHTASSASTPYGPDLELGAVGPQRHAQCGARVLRGARFGRMRRSRVGFLVLGAALPVTAALASPHWNRSPCVRASSFAR